jgi:phosphatidylglycerol---prolipoprotein diacylglyceryl transferase
MHPILFSLGGFDIRVWGVMLTLGVIAGLRITAKLAKGTEYTEDILLDFTLYATIVGLLGARLWEVAFSWGQYSNNLLHAFMFWEGGLSIQGAVVADTVFAWWYFRKKGLSFWRFADFAAPGLILGQAIGRIGCFFNGDAYGRPTNAWYGVVYQPGTPAYNAWGAAPLVPAELFEFFLDFAILMMLLRLHRTKRYEGQIALVYFILYSLGRFALEFLRTDSLMFAGVKVAQITALSTALAAICLLLARKAKATLGTNKFNK